LIFTRNLFVALCATFVAFCTLYTPQPILPLLAAEFSISPGDAGLLMTVTLLPLGIAPVVYGYFLQAIPAKLMLTVALVLLMLDQFAFYLATEFWHLIVLRSIQGFLLPAIFTALMTYCASMAQTGHIRKTMGWYIAATILGGFAGRIISGFFASTFEWQTVFVVLGIMLTIPIVMLRYTSADATISFDRLDIRTVSRVLRNDTFRYIYLVLFSLFFVFAGMLNVLPFRLQEIDISVSPLLISSLYIGYLIGIPIAIFCERIIRLIGDDKKGLLVGLVMHTSGLIAYLVSDFMLLYFVMFAFAAGFFFIHSTLSGLVNHLALEHRGVVNGLYVSIYYISGALGSWLPAYFYSWLGWDSLIMVFAAVLAVTAWLIMKLRISGTG
jgi:YNFM family putative membrane transporter